ncbi:hypothetical protein [Mesorhizobium sp. CAU 1732]|uniref:hypothetical protein n=1 Tax=Mesorhizobium sp. CAU 1732 TaxID=3140358 RepID=UPI003260017B
MLTVCHYSSSFFIRWRDFCVCCDLLATLHIFAVFGQTERMNAHELEPLLVELVLRGTDAATTSLASILDALATKTGGVIEFDIRVDHDTQIQRLASVMFAERQRVILALSTDGQQIVQAQVADAVDSDFFRPLALWFALPMREKPHVNVDAAAALLLGALRSNGQLPTLIG